MPESRLGMERERHSLRLWGGISDGARGLRV